MAKGPIITSAVQALINSVYQKHPKWKAPEVHNEVKYILHKDDSKLPSGWPSLSTVQKVLAIVRKKMKEEPEDPLDEPWSTASMVKYPIPAESLPSILQIWVWAWENVNYEITIRDVQWAARLYTVIKDIPLLSFISVSFAATETVHEDVGVSFETSHSADLFMFGLMTGQEITSERIKKTLGLEYHEALIKHLDREWRIALSKKELFAVQGEFCTPNVIDIMELDDDIKQERGGTR